MNLNINQKNIYGENNVNSKKVITNDHKTGFVIGVITAVVAEIIIRIFF